MVAKGNKLKTENEPKRNEMETKKIAEGKERIEKEVKNRK